MKTVKLGDIANVVRGASPRPMGDPRFFGGNIPWVKISDVTASDGRTLRKTKEGVTQEGQEKSRLVKKGELIVSNSGSIGKPVFMGIDGCIHDGFLTFLNISPKVEKIWIYWFFIWHKEKIHSLANLGTQMNLNTTIVKNIQIPLPQQETQKKIVAILDAANTLRQKTKTLIEKYDQLTQSLFLEMFGDPLRNNKKLPKIKLGKLGKWQSGGTPSRQKPQYFEGNIPWLSSGELNTIFSTVSKEYISNSAINESSAKIIAPESLLLGMYDTAALKSTINKVPLSCNQAIAYCKIDKEIANTIYIYYIIQIGKEHYRRLQRGVRQKNLNLSMINNIEILFPPLPLQNQYAKRVQAIEDQKAKAQASLEKSEELFQSLLQKAFKGEIY